MNVVKSIRHPRTALGKMRSALRQALPGHAAKPVSTSPHGLPDLVLTHVQALEARFPQLRDFGFEATGETAPALLAFYNAYLPLILPEARGAHLRSLLARLAAAAPCLAPSALDAIARSDLSEGLPDRAQRLRSDADLAATLADETYKLEAAYGAPLITAAWPNASRGASLHFYLEHHADLIRGRDVLHIAPEDEVRSLGQELAGRYVTMDGTPGNIDEVHDITAIGLPSESFDVILCHRVLEHISDDGAAMRELARLLRRGGLLNLSVPQAVHRPNTAEWVILDESHHKHVRHYGRDLEQRLERAGFEVRVEPWLLNQPREALLARSAYPMRMYNCIRSARNRDERPSS